MKRCLPAVLLLVPLALGCPKRVAPGPALGGLDAQALLQAVAKADARITSLKGEAKLGVDSPQAKGQLTLFVAAARPASVHLEPLDFFGRPQAVLVSDGKTFGLYQAQEGRYYQGPPSPQNLSRFLPVVLPPEELIPLLLGQAPRIPSEQVTAEEDAKSHAYVLTLTQGAVTQRLWIEPRTNRVLRSEVRGMNAYDLTFEDFQETGAVTFPRHIVLSSPAAKTKLELRYTDVTLNGTPDPSLYAPEPPEGVPVIDVDESGQPRANVGTHTLPRAQIG